MRSGLNLKFLILATLACIVITLVDIHIRKTVSGIYYFPPQAASAYVTLLIAWTVYIFEKIYKK